MQLIELRDVSKRYPTGVTALCDVNLQISKGEFIFVIGASGSGKSTLIKLLYRQEKPTGTGLRRCQLCLAGNHKAQPAAEHCRMSGRAIHSCAALPAAPAPAAP